MALEATMICIDNSEWMRNGDYASNRFQAEADAVNIICGAKKSNPENTVGVMTMAGKGARVLVTPTCDLGKILACMHGLEIGGEMNLAAAIQVAQLALKHRQNKQQQQRIIIFTGSPVKHEKKLLEMIGRKLKKNSATLDIVDFGEADDRPEKLEALLAAVNNNETSHIVYVPSGSNALCDVLLSTPIFAGDWDGGSGFAAAAAAEAVSGFDLGVDANLDPELALALLVSMEEERARQEAAAKKAAEEASKHEEGMEGPSSQDVTVTVCASASGSGVNNNKRLVDDESAFLQRALDTSLDDVTSSHHELHGTDVLDAATDDPKLALAFQMSVHDGAKDSSRQSEMTKLLKDQSFVSSILSSIPGVSVKGLLDLMQNQCEKGEDPKGFNQEEEKLTFGKLVMWLAVGI